MALTYLKLYHQSANYPHYRSRQTPLLLSLLVLLLTATLFPFTLQEEEKLPPKENSRTLQSAFKDATDPKVYESFLRPLGNCKEFKNKKSANKNFFKDQNQPLKVNMSLELYNYATVNDLTSEYTFQFFLDLEWCDERLILQREVVKDDNENDKVEEGDETRYGFIEGGQWHIDRIWKPSIFVANNEQAGSIDNDQQSLNMIRIDGKTGRIWLRKRKLLHIFCLMDYQLFPFDRQHCSVHFESNVHNSRHLMLSWGELFIDRRTPFLDQNPKYPNLKTQNLEPPDSTIIHNHSSFRTVGFQLMDIHLSHSIVSGLSGVNFSRCTFDFTLQREFAHHLMLAYLPSALIVAVSWTTFWLEITSPPARCLLGVATMLALVTNFKLTRDQLPSISYLNVLDIWNLVCISFIALSLVEFALVNSVYNTAKRIEVAKAIKRRSDMYREARRQKEEAQKRFGSSKYHRNLFRKFLSFNEKNKNSDKYSPSEATTISTPPTYYSNYLAEREILDDEENDHVLSSINPFSVLSVSENKQTDRSHTIVSFAEEITEENSSEIPSNTCKLQKGVSSLLTPPISTSLPVHPVLKRVQSGGDSSSVGSGSLTGSVRRGSTISSAHQEFMASRKLTGRRKSLLISSNLEVEACFELTPEQLAQRIDHWCRYIFPGSFTLFNILYWSSVFWRKANSQAPKW